MENFCQLFLANGNIYIYTGWWFQPLWKIWKSVGMIIPNILKNKKYTKPPISIYVYTYLHEIKWRGKDHLTRQSHIRVPPTVNTYYIIYIYTIIYTSRYIIACGFVWKWGIRPIVVLFFKGRWSVDFEVAYRACWFTVTVIFHMFVYQRVLHQSSQKKAKNHPDSLKNHVPIVESVNIISWIMIPNSWMTSPQLVDIIKWTSKQD